MRVIAFDRFRDGVTLKTIEPYLDEEVSNVWRLWKAGIVRENYARADEPGVVIMFEVPDVATAKTYTDDFPLSKAGLLEWSFIALQIPLPIETLFREGVDLNPPYDRTLNQPTEAAPEVAPEVRNDKRGRVLCAGGSSARIPKELRNLLTVALACG
jgi:hypothetical protein